MFITCRNLQINFNTFILTSFIGVGFFFSPQASIVSPLDNHVKDSIHSVIHPNICYQLELQSYLDQHWLMNNQLWDDLDCVKIQPRLFLYTKIDIDAIDHHTKCTQQLEQQIDFNVRFQQSLEELTGSAIVLQETKLQNVLLRIAHAFNQSLLYRKKHNFQYAMDCVDSSFPLIESYQSLLNEKHFKYFKAPDSLLSLAYYHKGKIHRMLAGHHLDYLDASQLQECEKCYLRALEIFPNNPIIHSSLGFLYNDMQRNQDALYHHRIANQLQPGFPDFMHGLGYSLYLIEQKKLETGKALKLENLEEAFAILEQAVELFEEYKSENSRIFLDRGKIKLLMGKYEEALEEFNRGIKLDPHHKLLCEEKILLISKIADMPADDSTCTHVILSHAEENNKTSCLKLPNQKQNIVISQNSPSKRKAFNRFLKECASYVQQLQGPKKIKIFICYAWVCPLYSSSNIEHDVWIEQFAKDLEMAGFEILFDRWITRKGHEKMDFVEKIMTDESDYIVVVGSKLFLDKYNDISLVKTEREKVLRIETRLLNHLVGFNQAQSNKVIPLLIEGVAENALPPLLRIKNLVDFTLNDYSLEMSEMIRDLHGIDQRDSHFKQLLHDLENTL